MRLRPNLYRLILARPIWEPLGHSPERQFGHPALLGHPEHVGVGDQARGDVGAHVAGRREAVVSALDVRGAERVLGDAEAEGEVGMGPRFGGRELGLHRLDREAFGLERFRAGRSDRPGRDSEGKGA